MNECKTGYLVKQGQKVKNWKKRWIALKDYGLHYYASKEDSSPLDSIALQDCSAALATVSESKRACCLKLVTPKRTWLFSAETDEEIVQWLDAIFSWGVRETREDEEIMYTLQESVNLVLSGAANLVQSVNIPSSDIFRESSKVALSRGETFSTNVQALNRFINKCSPAPLTEAIKDACNIANGIRDTVTAMASIAADARNLPQDADIKKKLSQFSIAVADKSTVFKKQLLDENKGLRILLRIALYGKDKAISSLRPVNLLNPAMSKQQPLSPQLNSSSPRMSVAPNTITSSRANFRSTQISAKSQEGTAEMTISVVEEQQVLFDEMIMYSRELTQVMKAMFPDGSPVASGVPPKQGYIIAISLVKAARDYANIHPDPAIRQDILNTAGRTFFATSQLFSPQEDEGEYSIDELLKSLSQSVVTLIKKVLQHHNGGLSSSSTSSSVGRSTVTGVSGGHDLSRDLKRSLSVATMQHGASTSPSHSPVLSRTMSSAKFLGPYTPTMPANLQTSVEGDVNIWDEKSTEGVNVTFADDEGLAPDGERPIRLGTLNQIVTRLTNEHKPDLRFVKTFITTYQSFTTPEMFLNKIIQRYQVPVSVMDESSLGVEQWRNQKLLPIQLRAYNVLKIWVDTRLSDFDEALLQKLGVFMSGCLRNDGHGKLADQLALKLKGSADNKKRLNLPFMPTMPTSIFWAKYNNEHFLGTDEDEVARQLTLIEFDNFGAIAPKELLNQAWNKAALKARAPNVLRMISRFNSISLWVAKMILSEEKLKQRVKVLTKVIRVAQSLYHKNNFNSLLAIMAGLNHSAVHRLKHTQDDLSTKDSESLVKFGELLSSDKGYKNYRARVHNINPPLLPYLGVYLTDLTFLEDGNPDNIDGLINFKKREMIFNVIAEIQQYQQTGYKYDPIDNYLQFLGELPLVEDMKAMDNELYEMSLQREPRSALKADIL